MPPQPECHPKDLEKKLQQWPTMFNKQLSLKPQQDPIWSEIKSKLKLKMSAKSLYLYMYKDKHQCKSNLTKYFKLNKKRKCIDPDFDPNEIILINPHNCQKISFEIVMPNSELIDSSVKKNIKKEWTDSVAIVICDESKLSCAFNLKNSWITNDEIFHFNGFCTDSNCQSGISGEGEPIDEKNYKFKILTFETYHIKHKKKRKLKGKRRNEVQEILLTKTPGKYREENLANLDTDYEPPYLNNSGTLGKARAEALDKKLGYKEFKGSSTTNRRFLEYCDVRKISLLPFYIWY